jgi:predicted branched-subunit amino acid permease
MEPKGSLLVPSLGQIIQSKQLQSISQRSILILSYHILMGFCSGRFSSGFSTKKKTLWTCLLSDAFYMLYSSQPPWLDHSALAKNTNYEIPYYAICFSLQLFNSQIYELSRLF